MIDAAFAFSHSTGLLATKGVYNVLSCDVQFQNHSYGSTFHEVNLGSSYVCSKCKQKVGDTDRACGNCGLAQPSRLKIEVVPPCFPRGSVLTAVRYPAR